MHVVVMVNIDRLAAKERLEFGGLDDDGGCTRTADVAIKAKHPVGRCHDEMQVVGDDQDAASGPVARRADMAIDFVLSGYIDARVGSSSTRSSGWPNRARASKTRCRSPPERS